ncbi:MAG: hypothetical protein FWF75_03865 [Propionibacteriaceae bacterium]|nr:hypothetical protein [Propionibacteriaceae bacterium]
MSATSAAPATPANKAPRILSLLVAIIGVVMLIIGIAVYAGVSVQLREQNITVAAISAADPGSDAGKTLAGPFTAMAQVNAIRHHVSEATGGKTFGQIKSVATSDGQTYNADVTAANSTDGQAHAQGSPLSSADAKQYAARITAQQGSWTQASLLVSVVAFGVGALIVGLGLVVIVIGLALMATQGMLGKKNAATARE